MRSDRSEVTDYKNPVAYDVEGRPLYLHPDDPQAQFTEVNSPSASYETYGSVAEAEVVSPHVAPEAAPSPYPPSQSQSSQTPFGESPDAIAQKRSESVLSYPNVHLDEDEYVVMQVPRAMFGVMIPMMGAIFVAILLIGGMIIYPDIVEEAAVELPSPMALIGPVLLLLVLDGLIAYMAFWVYYRNRLYVTNKHAIGYVQRGLFDRKIQKASLDRIEDVSSHQPGLLATMFNYGRIHMSTIGDESTYLLTFVESPRQQAERINDIVSRYKDTSSQAASRWRNP